MLFGHIKLKLFNYSGYDMNLFMVYARLLSSGSFWLLSVVVIVAGLLPDYTLKALQAINVSFSNFYPGSRRKKTKVAPTFSQTTYL